MIVYLIPRYATKAPNDAKDETDDTHGDGSRFLQRSISLLLSLSN